MNQTSILESLPYTSQQIYKYATSIDNIFNNESSTKTTTILSYEYIAIISAIIFIALSPFKTKNKFELDSFIHAIITGIGSAMCVYLDQYVAEELTGIPEPLGQIRCQKPLTTLHVILPAVTLGYSINDIYQCVTKDQGMAFLFHGIAMFASTATCCQLGLQPLLTRGLIMEISTIFLNLSSIELLGPYIQGAIQLSFVFSFFLTRNVGYPYIWYQFISTYNKESLINNGNFCFPSFMFYFIFFSGLFFNCLNLFWLYKLIRKVKRKLTGKQGMKDTKRE